MSDHTTETSDGLRFARAKGGIKIHLLPKGTMRALCGHEPSNKRTWRMRERAGWWAVRIDMVLNPSWCEKCQQRRK